VGNAGTPEQSPGTGRSQLLLWGAWQRFTTGSVNRRIFGAAAVVGSINLGVMAVYFLQDLATAAIFGAGDLLDAFLIAYLVPKFVVVVVAGSFNAALIPVYVKVREERGEDAARELLAGVVFWSTLLLTGVTVLLALAGPGLLRVLGAGFGPEKLALTHGLFYALLPSILLSGLATLWGAALNARERFALAALAGVLVPAGGITGLLVLGRSWGIYGLAAGIVAGHLLQVGLLARDLRRQGLGAAVRWHPFGPDLREVIGQYLPAVAGAALTAGTLLVDSAMASLLPAGSVASLGYGNKPVTLIVGLCNVALGTAVLPYFSRLVAQGDWGGLRHALRTWAGVVVLATVPVTVLAVAGAGPLIALLFQRGKFSAADTALVSQVEAMYALQVPCHVLGVLFVRLISAFRANRILMWGAAIGFGVNLVLDYALMRVLGAPGIALATALVYTISCGYLGLMLGRRLRVCR
jgi:putative peptidoglycan lipid II flippase